MSCTWMPVRSSRLVLSRVESCRDVVHSVACLLGGDNQSWILSRREMLDGVKECLLVLRGKNVCLVCSYSVLCLSCQFVFLTNKHSVINDVSAMILWFIDHYGNGAMELVNTTCLLVPWKWHIAPPPHYGSCCCVRQEETLIIIICVKLNGCAKVRFLICLSCGYVEICWHVDVCKCNNSHALWTKWSDIKLTIFSINPPRCVVSSCFVARKGLPDQSPAAS